MIEIGTEGVGVMIEVEEGHHREDGVHLLTMTMRTIADLREGP